MSNLVNTSVRKLLVLILAFVGEARRRSPVLFWASVGHLLLMVMMLAIAPFDERLVTGINPWIKPIKFALANSVFMLTIGWLLPHLPASEKGKLRVSRLLALAQITEIVLITLQAGRGTTSHHNISTLVNLGILGIMGLMIVLNTIVVAYVALKFWSARPAVPAPYLWGIRLGLLIFLLASLEGFVMVRFSSHSVGVTDGGPGLPLIHWNATGGDLRVAHFVGLHAFQVLTLVGYLFSLPVVAERLKNPSYWVWALGILYAAVALMLFLQALSGSPLLSFSVV